MFTHRNGMAYRDGHAHLAYVQGNAVATVKRHTGMRCWSSSWLSAPIACRSQNSEVILQTGHAPIPGWSYHHGIKNLSRKICSATSHAGRGPNPERDVCT